MKLEPPTPDPFRDVIRTEPAPDLPSLIEDMLPYLEHRIPPPPVTTPLTFEQKISSLDEVDKYEDVLITTMEPRNSSEELSEEIEISTKKMINESNYDEGIFSFDSVLDLFFKDTKDSETSTTNSSGTTEIHQENTSTERTASTEKIVSSTKNFPDEEEIFFEEKLVTLMKNSSTTENYNSTEESLHSEKKTEAPPIGGLLKLAGCNIYGRMYRVGRIIVELSTPCLECRCTDLGVQCKQLEC